MTSKAGGGKPYRGRREWRRTQLREAGAPALAAGRPQSPADPAAPEGGEGETPHYHGHRERLRSRLKEAGDGALADYELLELVLFRAIPRRDVKPLAKALIAKFGSFAETIAADPGRLAEVEGMSAGAVAEFKIVEAAAQRFAKGAMKKRLPMGSWSEVIDYCRTSMAFEGARNIPGPVSRQEERPDRRRGSRAGHRRSYPGLPARSGSARAATVGDRDHPRSQSPVGRSDPIDPGRQDDPGHHRGRQEFGRHRPRPHHRRT